jgi:hypothetical protein
VGGIIEKEWQINQNTQNNDFFFLYENHLDDVEAM